ncbi:hypothetical protein CTA1_1728 [Colletotrichum tanaceti]|uniref:Uncharacterized protein n=1 Tax=Colletotrichum tanaceti TaxID=1306861 RepID=A0A4U6X100_9PEZI|nr:hypothetical protein CTA1_1728 [Colletotrichum tanaceti]
MRVHCSPVSASERDRLRECVRENQCQHICQTSLPRSQGVPRLPPTPCGLDPERREKSIDGNKVAQGPSPLPVSLFLG